MKHKFLTRLSSLLLALALLLPHAAAISAPNPDPCPEPAEGPGPMPMEQSAPASGPVLIQTSRQLTDALTYINTVSQHPALGRSESFTLELAPGSGVYPITVQGDGTVYYSASITRAIALAKERGFHVLAAINSDFFVPATGVPLGLAIEDGLYLSSGGSEAAVVFTEDGAALVDNAYVEITLENGANGAVCSPTRYNKQRDNSYGLWLLNSRYSSVSSRTTGEGWFVKLRILEGELTVNGTMSLEVAETFQLNGACALEEGYLYLTAGAASNQSEIWASFQPGDPVTLTTRCEDEALSRARWATGCGDVLVRDGALTDSAAWDQAIAQTAPRTALGVKADGSLVCHVADGRRSGHSLGLTLADLAQQMLELGCIWAVNLDGGGSSAMSVRLPGSSDCQVVNRPSDNTPRRCASYLLLVSDDPGDGVPVGLALTGDGSAALTGSSLELGSVVAYDSGLNPVEADLSGQIVFSANLGAVEDGVYTAGATPGLDVLTLYSPSAGLSGSAQIWVTDSLTALSAAPSALNLGVGEQAALSTAGSFWSRPALRSPAGVLFQVEGEVGTVDEAGLFTAAGHSGSGAVIVTAGGLSTAIPVLVHNIHTDVTEGDWSYEAVEHCYNAGITSGVSATLFGRGEYITRGDFVLMLHRAAGSPAAEAELPFLDVAPDDYYAAAIAWAWQNGLISGIGDGSFGARVSITRQDAFTILGRALPLLSIEAGPTDESYLAGYSDLALLADYARGPVCALTAAGVVRGGSDGLLRPVDPITREQTAAVLYRCLTDPQPAAPAALQSEQPGGLQPDEPAASGPQSDEPARPQTEETP